MDLRIYLKNAIIKLYKKIKHKDAFLAEIKKHSELMYEIFRTENFDEIVFMDKNLVIEEQKEKINQGKATEVVLKNLKARYVKKYIVPQLKQSTGEKIYIISVVNDYNLYSKCVTQNPFITNLSNIELVDFDNTKENITIPKRYNSFLNNYDFSKNAWFVFCHCDWELMDDINLILKNLDKNSLYGVIGSKLYISKNKYHNPFLGHCLECRRDGTGIYKTGEMENNLEEVDTFDCQCLIVHSSLINKYNLRFDENLTWDLYVEDFCIQANKLGIKSYATGFDSCHWSGYHVVPDSYYESLKYINNKYPDSLYSGTCSIIGGKPFDCEPMDPKDYLLFKMRQKLKR